MIPTAVTLRAIHCLALPTICRLSCLRINGGSRASLERRLRHGAQSYSEQDTALYSVPAAVTASVRFMLRSLRARCTLRRLRCPRARPLGPSLGLFLR